eukprot:5105464-Prymnesium_polylepis.2
MAELAAVALRAHRIGLKPVITHTRPLCEHLTVAAAPGLLRGPAVVRRRVRQRPARAAAAARHPHTDVHQPLGAVHIVEQHVRDAHPPVAVVQPVRVGRRVVKVDKPRHALKRHALDQRVEQLAPHHLRAVLHLDQVV